jgi:hypothetical protein
MYPLLKRPEADALAAELESLAQARYRHELVVALRELAGAIYGRPA